MASYLEHMALRVKDLDWHIRFFEDVFDMPVRMELGEAPNRKVWLHAGIQLNEAVDYDGCGFGKGLSFRSKRTAAGTQLV